VPTNQTTQNSYYITRESGIFISSFKKLDTTSGRECMHWEGTPLCSSSSPGQGQVRRKVSVQFNWSSAGRVLMLNCTC
jgi:hypothetical protein